MPSKRYLPFFALIALLVYGSINLPLKSWAASPSDDGQIPSDLSLDLELAQKDPAPEQKQITQSQINQAKIVTDKGEQATVSVKAEIPKEVKLQSASDAENPEQTTSEQVVSKAVEVVVSPNATVGSDQTPSTAIPSGSPADNAGSTGNRSATAPADNIIPGTDILDPDDNAAPPINTNPNQPKQNITPSESNNINPSQPADTPQPNNNQAVSTTDTDVPSNTSGATQGTTTSQNDTAPQNPNPPTSDGTSQDSTTNNAVESKSPSEAGDSAVQGISSQRNLPWWQMLLIKVIKSLGGKNL